MSQDIELLLRRLKRERLARKQAEQVAEETSRALFLKSQDLENALETEQATKKEIETLFNALETFAAKHDVQEIARSLHRFLNRFISSQSTTIYLRVDQRIQAISVREESGGNPVSEFIEDVESVQEGELTAHDCEPCILEVGGPEDRRAGFFNLSNHTRAVMVLPLVWQGRLLGHLTAENQHPGSYNDQQVRFAQALANQAALALENARLFREVERFSLTDPLTGLQNRRGFQQQAQPCIALALRYDKPLSALMFDLDFFKKVNDTYGHGMGDQVLVKVAQLCRQVSRATDLPARLGGEEFCLLLPNTNSQDAWQLAERLRDLIAQYGFQAKGESLNITVSIGVSQYLGSKDTLEDLLERGDVALYNAKQTGRNRTVIWRDPVAKEDMGQGEVDPAGQDHGPEVGESRTF